MDGACLLEACSCLSEHKHLNCLGGGDQQQPAAWSDHINVHSICSQDRYICRCAPFFRKRASNTGLLQIIGSAEALPILCVRCIR